MPLIFLREEDNQDSKEFSLLNSISATLSSSLDLKDTLSKIFKTLHAYMGLSRAVIVLIDPKTNEPHIETGYGLTQEEKKLKVQNRKKGLHMEVIESEKGVVIPDLSQDPEILKTLGGRKNPKNTSFICLPIKLKEQKLGSISIDCPFKGQNQLMRNTKVLSFFCLMIAQEIKLTQMINSVNEALKNENTRLKSELKQKYNIHNMIGNSNAMHQVYESIMQVAESNATVLIRGESGTGKELVAHAIHYNSKRANGPFIKVNCSAIPENLIESELFGYEKGAFTGAEEAKIGKFEASDGGTVFLDEIGELSPNLQVKLLRVLQEKEFERVGGINSVKIDVRVITATNRDLEKGLEEKTFRHDLYYRLNVFPIYIPPLKERKTDILLLADHFLEKFTKENHRNIQRISQVAIDLLNAYHWPGNVRELENCMERAVLLCQGNTLYSSHLPLTLRQPEMMEDLETQEKQESPLSFEKMVHNFEKEVITDALKKTKWNKSKAARRLHTTQRIVNYKIGKLNIQKKADE